MAGGLKIDKESEWQTLLSLLDWYHEMTIDKSPFPAFKSMASRMGDMTDLGFMKRMILLPPYSQEDGKFRLPESMKSMLGDKLERDDKNPINAQKKLLQVRQQLMGQMQSGDMSGMMKSLTEMMSNMK